MGLQVEIGENGSYISWRIQNFSSIRDERLFSDIFTVRGNKWQFFICPKGGRHLDHLSIYLVVPNSETLHCGWSRYVEFGFAVVDQSDSGTFTITKADRHKFTAEEVARGFNSFLPLSQFHTPKRGYLINDACLVVAYISSDRTKGLILRKLILKTESDKQKTMVSDRVTAAIDTQETTITKPVEITPPPSSQPSFPIMDIEPIESEEQTEEDMYEFFTGLEAELSSCKIVFSHEDAKEALSKLGEAFNMTPTDLYNSRKFSQLKQACKILASFADSSTTLTIEQKNELSAMEERLKELADRAAKAEVKQLESSASKLTIKLNHNLIRYKEVVSEVKQVELKLASLLAEQKGIFKSSKEMKMELEALGNEWPDYEAKAKVAEEEEKIVEAEWGRMKDFVSSMKGKFLKTC